MKSSALPYWLTLAVVLAALYGGYTAYRVAQARSGGGVLVVPNLPPLEDFELVDQHGRPFRSAEMKGKVWVASFFYSTCPFSCARLNANIRYLTTLEELKDVTWVSVTVDPVTDTQPVLEAYAKQLGAPEHWLLCRHDDFRYIERVGEDVLKAPVDYKGHNDRVIVIDRQGKIAGVFDGYSQDDLDKGVELIKKCLAEPAEADSSRKEAA
jgi:cytochrome oxidase Cu insertion factor (SCO1/SenC/PrrC family)